MVEGCSLEIRGPRFLSETAAGEDVRLTVRLSKRYPSVRRLENAVRMFLRLVEAVKRPEILLVVGDWGEGKTFVYKAYIEPWCVERGAYCVKVEASRVVDILEEVVLRSRGASPAAQLLEALLSAALGRRVSLEEASSPGAWRGTLPPKILVFVDEAEYLVSLFDDPRRSHLVPRFLEGLTQLANLSPESPQGVPEALVRRVHVAVAFSRQAFNTLQERGETSQIMGRLTRRAVKVEPRRLTIVESLVHLSSLTREVLGAELVDAARPPTLLNLAVHAAAGLPAAIERLANSLAVRVAEGCPEGRGRPLTLQEALGFYEALEYSIEGADVKPLILDEYRGVEAQCVDRLSGALGRRGALEACRLILLSLLHVTRDLLGDRFDPAADLLEEYVHVVRVYRLAGDPIEALDGLLGVISRVIEEGGYEYLLRELLGAEYERGGDKAELVYRALLDPLAGYCPDGSVCIAAPRPRLLRDLLGVEERKAERLAELADRALEAAREKGLVEHVGEAIVVSAQLASRYVFSQELQLLSFIPRGERLEVWRRVSRGGVNQRPLTSLGLAPYAAAAAARILGGEARVTSVEVDEESGVAELRVEVDVDARVRVELEKRRAVKPPAAARVAVVPLDALSAFERVVAARRPWERPHLAIVYGIGVSPSEERLRALEDLGVAAVPLVLGRSVAVRLAAIALQARRYNRARLGDTGIVEELRRMLAGARAGLSGFDAVELQRVASRLLTLLDVESLAAHARGRLEALGALLPQRLVASREEQEMVEPQRLREAALWLSHYPRTLDKPRPVTEVYEAIVGSVRRYALYGRRYGHLLGPDIESARELLKRIEALENLELVEVHGESVRLRAHSSRYTRRLAMVSEPTRLEDIAALFIDPGGQAIQALLEVAWVLGLLVKHGELYRYVSEGDVWAAANRLSASLAALRDQYGGLARRMGYIVQAKKRAYEVTTLNGLIESIEGRVEEARRAAERGLIEEAARLLRSAETLARGILGVEPGSPRLPRPASSCAEESRYLQLVQLADHEYRRLQGMLSSRASELRRLVEGIEETLSLMTSRGVRVRPDVLGRLEEVLEESKKLYEQELSEEEIREKLRPLWERYRDIPEQFPFYYERAKAHCYNYKLWLLREQLGADKVLEEAEEAISALGSLAESLRRGYEEVHVLLREVRGLYERVAERARRLGVVLPPLAAGGLARVEPSGDAVTGSLHEVASALRGLLERWRERNRLDWLKRLLEEASALLEGVESLEAQLSSLASRASRLRGLASEAARAVSNSPLAASLAEHLGRLDELLAEALASVEARRARAGARAESLEEAVRLLKSLVDELERRAERGSRLLAEAERKAIEARRAAAEEARRLVDRYAVIEALRSVLGAGGRAEEAARLVEELRSEIALEPGDAEEALRGIMRIASTAARLASLGAPEEILEGLREELGLDELSLRALEVLAEEGAVTLKRLAEKLGVGRREALEVLETLEERGLVEITARPRSRRT